MMTRENTPELWKNALPWPKPEGHKYNRGHLLVVAGGMEKSGAAKLAAEAALRAGAGLVTILCPVEALTAYAESVKSIMLHALGDESSFRESLKAPHCDTLVIGPGNGVGEVTRQHVLTALSLHKKLVIDADAITSFKEQRDELWKAIAENTAVLTPHEGEFKALFSELTGTRNERAIKAAEESGAVIVLKGAQTIIASPNGENVIQENASAWLATAGSGDVLSGIIGGLMAGGMEAFKAACAGVWMHARAAEIFGPGLISEDLPNLLPKVLRELLTSAY